MQLKRLFIAIITLSSFASWGQNNDITLTTRNQNQNGQEFTFDVYANTTSGSTFLGDADIVFSTSATKFSSIAAASSNVNADITTINAAVVGSDVVVNIQGDFGATATSDFPEITTTPVKLFTITLTTVSDFSTTPDIAYVTSGSPRTKIYEVYTQGSRLRQKAISGTTFTNPTAGTAPIAAATNFTGDFSTPGQATLAWDAATDSVLIVARAGSAVANGPINTVGFNADNNFGDGDSLNTGSSTEYVVGKYDGTATGATITGLANGTTYHFAIYKFSGGSGQTEAYGPGATATGTSLQAEPTTAATSIVFSNIDQTGFDVAWTQGDGDNVLVVVRYSDTAVATPNDGEAYTANSTFGSGDTTGTENYVVFSAANTGSLSIAGLTAGKDYTVEIYEFNGSGSDNNYLTSSYLSGNQYSMFAEPSTAFAGVTATTQSANSIQVTWTDPSEANNSWVVVARLSSDAATAPGEGDDYLADAAYGDGEAIGDGFVVYNGDGTSGSVTVTGLDQNETYAFDVYAYTGTAASDSAVLNYSDASDASDNDATWLETTLTMILEGPYDGSDMSSANITVPSSQPYNTAPWSYAGSESNGSIGGTVVDWVLVELRTSAFGSDSAYTVAYQQACLLLDDGSIVAADGSSTPVFELTAEGDYYVAIQHRNHLAVSSDTTLTDNGTSAFAYDFSTQGGTGTDAMFDYNGDASLYVMFGGWTDSATDDVINAGDYSAVYSDRNTTNAYSNSDANLDGVIDADDRAIVFNNRDYSTQAP